MKERILDRRGREAQRFRLYRCCLPTRATKCMKAETGEEGLKLTLQQKPDLILLDIRLPGYRTASRFCRSSEPVIAIPAVIIMTAETTSSNAIRATQYGAFDYISKPINDEHLILLIRKGARVPKT